MSKGSSCKSLRLLLFGFSWFLLAVSLMVVDELIGNLYNHSYTYPFPVGPVLSIWQAWEVAFAGIVGSFILLAVSLIGYER
jgi:hypothetical protein